MYRQKQLYFAGIVLFLLGLLGAFIIPALTNPRLGLSAHLEGVMNGMFLILVGLIWEHVQLSTRLKTAVFALLLWGTYVNWFACLVGGAVGASHMTPIAGQGFSALPWQELVVSALFGSVGLTMVVALVLLAWGLRKINEP